MKCQPLLTSILPYMTQNRYRLYTLLTLGIKNEKVSSIRCHPDPGCPRQLEGWLSAASKPVGAEARGSRQLAPSRSSPTSLLPFSVRSHGSALPHGRGPQQGSQGDQERGQAEAQPPPRGEYQGARLVGRNPSSRRAGPGQRLPQHRRGIEGRGNWCFKQGEKECEVGQRRERKGWLPSCVFPFSADAHRGHVPGPSPAPWIRKLGRERLGSRF